MEKMTLDEKVEAIALIGIMLVMVTPLIAVAKGMTLGFLPSWAKITFFTSVVTLFSLEVIQCFRETGIARSGPIQLGEPETG